MTLATAPSPCHPGLQDLLAAEAARFTAEHPRSVAMAGQAAQVWRGGAPMHWMNDWASPSPIFAAQGVGAQITDVDGRLYDDFCLGDTPSMFGHSEPSVAEIGMTRRKNRNVVSAPWPR